MNGSLSQLQPWLTFLTFGINLENKNQNVTLPTYISAYCNFVTRIYIEGTPSNRLVDARSFYGSTKLIRQMNSMAVWLWDIGLSFSTSRYDPIVPPITHSFSALASSACVIVGDTGVLRVVSKIKIHHDSYPPTLSGHHICLSQVGRKKFIENLTLCLVLSRLYFLW